MMFPLSRNRIQGNLRVPNNIIGNLKRSFLSNCSDLTKWIKRTRIIFVSREVIQQGNYAGQKPHRFRMTTTTIMRTIRMGPFLSIRFKVRIYRQYIRRFKSTFLQSRFSIRTQIIFSRITPGDERRTTFHRRQHTSTSSILITTNSNPNPLSNHVKLTCRNRNVFMRQLTNQYRNSTTVTTIRRDSTRILFRWHSLLSRQNQYSMTFLNDFERAVALNYRSGNIRLFIVRKGPSSRC